MSISVITTQTARPTNSPTRVSALCIANPDGTPRWIWPAASRRPEFLSFYPATTRRQRLFRLLVRLVFLLRLQRMVFAATTVVPEVEHGHTDWALFTGTVGPNRKRVLLCDDRTVEKTAVGPAAAANLDNEASVLRALQRVRADLPFRFPRLRHASTGRLAMERLTDRGTWNKLTDGHVEALGALRTNFPGRATLSEWREWPVIHERLRQLEESAPAKIPPSLLRDLLCLADDLDGDTPIEYTYAHGDFTPWNTLRTTGEQLGIIDWELARPGMPVGTDYFHFHLQQGILVGRKGWKEIHAEVKAGLTPAVKRAVFGSEEADADLYLRLYLLHHVTYYLDLYARQPAWHAQVFWQLEVWQEALLSVQRGADQRRRVIGQLFRLLASQQYAVFKLGDLHPEDLPADSDFDILVRRGAVDGLIGRIERLGGVERVRTVRKSFMASLLLVLTDGQVLSLDLIWKLKRRATVFLDAGRMINGARTNSHGIGVVNAADTESYLRLFYGLNGQPVPEKYGLEELPLHPRPRPENQGIKRLGNVLEYLVDSIRTALTNRGFVVTFSGVDGAGKSTVIAAVVPMIDKRLRRPVKVLRHRPSLLPILSAYVHGKEGAEQRSIARLPRTGTNRSLLSSLFRFGYYYTDYLAGQLYVYGRYVLRGYAVVYDRYYYDFMLDARRSNLHLPEFITRWGLALLLKPEFNFFLYADAGTILSRKQELDRPTIERLTHDYRRLFARCQDRYPDRVFHSRRKRSAGGYARFSLQIADLLNQDRMKAMLTRIVRLRNPRFRFAGEVDGRIVLSFFLVNLVALLRGGETVAARKVSQICAPRCRRPDQLRPPATLRPLSEARSRCSPRSTGYHRDRPRGSRERRRLEQAGGEYNPG